MREFLWGFNRELDAESTCDKPAPLSLSAISGGESDWLEGGLAVSSSEKNGK
jgi:hypothetical protein